MSETGRSRDEWNEACSPNNVVRLEQELSALAAEHAVLKQALETIRDMGGPPSYIAREALRALIGA